MRIDIQFPHVITVKENSWQYECQYTYLITNSAYTTFLMKNFNNV